MEIGRWWKLPAFLNSQLYRAQSPLVRPNHVSFAALIEEQLLPDSSEGTEVCEESVHLLNQFVLSCKAVLFLPPSCSPKPSYLSLHQSFNLGVSE